MNKQFTNAEVREYRQAMLHVNDPKGTAMLDQLAAMLAERESAEPVGYISKATLEKLRDPEWQEKRGESVELWTVNTPPSRAVIPVFAHPAPRQSVPDERQPVGGLDHGWVGEYNRGWNDCRAAMLAAAPAPAAQQDGALIDEGGKQGDCPNCFEGRSDMDHVCPLCGGKGKALPELRSDIVNDARWKFVKAMPHALPAPVFNDLKPALYAALRYYHERVIGEPTAAPAAQQDDKRVRLIGECQQCGHAHDMGLQQDDKRDALDKLERDLCGTQLDWETVSIGDIRAAIAAQKGQS